VLFQDDLVRCRSSRIFESHILPFLRTQLQLLTLTIYIQFTATMRTTNAFTAFFCYFTWSIGHAFAPLEQSARLRSTKLADSFIEETILASMPTFNINGPSTIKKCRSSASRVNNRHSSRDWIHNVASLPRSSVLREIMNPVLSITAWSTVVSVAHKLMKASSSTLWNNFAINMCVPTSVHSLIVSSLGLLLVFRTNSAYQRFVVSNKLCVNNYYWDPKYSLQAPSKNDNILTIYLLASSSRSSGRQKDLGTNFVCIKKSLSNAVFIRI